MAIIDGTVYNDTIYGTNFRDIISGYQGDDNLFGRNGFDDLYGDAGDDILRGGLGDDFLAGGTGNDRLFGEAGDDLLDGGPGSDRIDGGEGFDAVIYADAFSVSVNLTTGRATGDGADVLVGIEDVVGSDYADTLVGSGAENILEGLAGSDRIDGLAGKDSLYGDEGNDRLTGGADRDYLDGGSGFDTFVFTLGASGITTGTADVIAAWNGNQDLIDAPVAGTAANYRESATNASTINAAAAFAEATYTAADVVHVFLYNAGAGTGYLVSDLDRDGTFETGVVLRNAGRASSFDFDTIV